MVSKKTIIVLIIFVLLILSVPTSAQLMNSAWAKARHDLENTGKSLYNSASNGTTKWKFNITNSSGDVLTDSSLAIGSDDIIYFGLDFDGFYGYGQGQLYAVYPNGTLKWNLSFWDDVDSTPIIDENGVIYVGDWSDNITAVYENGTIKWVYRQPQDGELRMESITIYNDSIIFAVNDYVKALHRENGTVKWQSNFNVCPSNNWVENYYPAISNGVVYNLLRCGRLVANYAENGTALWNFTSNTKYINGGNPAIDANGIIYFADIRNYYDPPSYLYAIYPNGTKKWEHTLIPSGSTYAYYGQSPAIDNQNGKIYFKTLIHYPNPNWGYSIYAVYLSNGTKAWDYKFSAHDSDASVILDGQGNIYYSYSETVESLYPNGTFRWNNTNFSYDMFYYAAATGAVGSDGTIYMLGDDDGYYGVATLVAFESQAVAPSTFDPSGYVYFQDVDKSTNPLPDALVKINDTLYDYTDASGYYEIPDVPNGNYTLHVNHSDAFATDSKTISNAEPNNDFILKFTQGFRFVQLTDVHIGPDPLLCGFGGSESLHCLSSFIKSINRFKAASDDIISRKPDFVLVTGDLVEWNSAFQYTAFNELISKFKENNITVYIVPGNHDRRGKEFPTWDYPITNPFFPNNDLTNYKKYIGDGNNYDIRDNFFNQNDYQFIGLDSGHDPNFSISNLPQLVLYPNGSGLSLEQINFMNNNIIDGKTIIFMHHPAVDDSCLDNSCNVITENRDLFVALAKDKHVKLALTGHTHESKFFDSNGKVSNTFNRYGTVTGTISINSINTFINVNLVRSPLFIQTRSATKDEDALHGYLAVNVGGMSILKEEMSLVDVKMTGSTSAPVTILYLNSPADLHAYDESGRHTGINATGEIENSIPDSYYFEEYKIGNTTLPAFVLLYNTTLNYSYEIVSNFSRENITSDQATFNFTIEQKTPGAITTIKYNNVSINRDSKAYLRINTTQANYTMQIDLNNDSIIDTTKQPDTVETDYAPTATILSPSDGSIRDQEQPVAFNGSGIDREDGTLNKLTWVSDRDDVIGHGNFTAVNLSAGVHNIILLVNDSAGQVNTSNIVIAVRDTQPPVLNIEYPPENKIFNRQNITVRGFGYDDSGILNVTVNDLQASKENWDVILSLNEGLNIINVTATDNKGFSSTANRTVYYNSSLASDTEPPATITNLTHKTGYSNVNRGWINWTWDNPRDADFSYVIIYLDNIPVENTSRSYFKISGLSSNANYTITIQSADIVDNINLTEFKDTAKTAENDPPPTTNTPEAIIKFDTSSEDFRVYNSETGVEVSFVELPSKLRQYTLRDSAGNTLSLILKHKNVKNGAEINVISMQYNSKVIEAAKNTARAEYSEKKGMPRELQQKIEIKKLFDAGAKYSARKGETEIKIKSEGQKELKQTRAGIAMLELLTDNGSLKLRY